MSTPSSQELADEGWEEFARWLIEEYRDMRRQRDKFWDLWLTDRAQALLAKRRANE